MPNRSRGQRPFEPGVYTRISWDPAGHGAGVERQRLDCEALCADRGWEMAQYFEDNDASRIQRQAAAGLRADAVGGRACRRPRG